MKNSCKVTIRFSFKGENYSPSCVIDLDQHMQKDGRFPLLDLLVAKHNDIDTYSYLYEVMQQGSFEFTELTGLASRFCHDNTFDIAGFEEEWQKQQIMRQLQDIATEAGLDLNLEDHSKIRSALLRAYEAGQKNR